ncbi:putative lipoprotein [Burkholderia pseudomallei MSHR684]|nr:putative lipoprotein [Burkholderia pseudomallei MSHR684]
MAAQHGGGLSGDEQRVLNQELDVAARAIGE